MGDLPLKGLAYLSFSHLNPIEDYRLVLPQFGRAAAHSRFQETLKFFSAAGKPGFREAWGSWPVVGATA